MEYSMTTPKWEIIYYFDEFHPKRIEDVPFQWVKLGTGVFREAYLIEGVIVAKFPILNYCSFHNIQHTLDEFSTIYKNSGVGNALAKYTPEIYYINEDNGVILQEYYGNVGKFKYKEYKVFKDLVYKILGYTYDIDKDQFGRDKNGQLICFDWGHLGNNEKLEAWNKGQYLQN